MFPQFNKLFTTNGIKQMWYSLGQDYNDMRKKSEFKLQS